MLRNDPVAASSFKDRTLALHPLRADYWRTWVFATLSTVILWLERGRSRRALAALDDHQLRDIGVTRADAQLESEKPFWRG